jgi:hypothetical protein
MIRTKQNTEKLGRELYNAKVGLPYRFPYMFEIKNMFPDLSEKQTQILYDTWNRRRSYDLSNEDNPYWAVELLIKVCKAWKDNNLI